MFEHVAAGLDHSTVPCGNEVPFRMFTWIWAVAPCTFAIRVGWPTASAVRTGKVSVEIVASVISLIVQVASERGRPNSSIAVKDWVPPTSMFTFAGVIRRDCGAGSVPLRPRWKFEPATLPATSVARTTTRLTPTLSEMLQENAPPEAVVTAPLQATEETPDSVSDTVPETVTLEFENAVPSAGEVIARTGIVLSMLRVTLVVEVSPLTSVAVPLIS